MLAVVAMLAGLGDVRDGEHDFAPASANLAQERASVWGKASCRDLRASEIGRAHV